MKGGTGGIVVKIGGGILDDNSGHIVDGGSGGPVVINGGGKLVDNNSD